MNGVSVNVDASPVQHTVTVSLYDGTRIEKVLPVGASHERARAEAKLVKLCHPGRVARLSIDSRSTGSVSEPPRTMVMTVPAVQLDERIGP